MLCYDVPNWDRRQWERFAQQQERDVQLLIEKRLPNFSEFCGEVFHRLYSYDAERLEGGLIRPELRWAERLHEALDQDPKFSEFSAQSLGHSLAAGFGAMAFGQTLAKSLPRPSQPLTNVQELRQVVLGMKRAGMDPVEIERMVADGKYAVAKANAYAAQVERFIEGGGLAQVVSAAVEQATESNELINGLGWGLGTMSPTWSEGQRDNVMQLASALSRDSRLREIAKLAGRMKQIAKLKQKQVSKEARHTLAGLEYGRDLSKVRASELVLTLDPVTAPLFYKRYADNELTQIKLRGKERLGNGPLVICVDASGSMAGAPDCWAKALATTLLGIAQAQRRDAAIIHYNGDVVLKQEFQFKTQHQPNTKALLNSLNLNTEGGTNWYNPLNHALALIGKSNCERYRQADIVFITDGDCQLEKKDCKAMNEHRRELKTNIYGLAVDCRSHSLKPFCDQVFEISISDPNNLDKMDMLFDIGT